MNRKIYLQPMTFTRYDEGHALVYLNEEVIENYQLQPAADSDEQQEPKTVTAYAYTGPMPDGGTLVDAADDSRDTLIGALIRAQYTQSEEDAIKTHQLMRIEDPDTPKAADYASEWAEFKVQRQAAIDIVDKWLSIK